MYALLNSFATPVRLTLAAAKEVVAVLTNDPVFEASAAVSVRHVISSSS